jgi:hypothetical protein
MSSVTTSGTTRSAFSFARIWDQFGMLVVLPCCLSAVILCPTLPRLLI